MNLKDAAEMALEALQVMKAGQHEEEKAYMDKAIEALRQALAQSDQEHFCDSHCVHTDHHPDCELAQPEQESYEDVVSHWHYWQAKAEEYRHKYEPPQPEQIGFNGLTESEAEQTMSVKELSTEQRPLYFRNKETGEMCTGGFLAKHIDRWQPLYEEPPKREWVGLTDEELNNIPENGNTDWMKRKSFARAIEAKLKEKNHG